MTAQRNWCEFWTSFPCVLFWFIRADGFSLVMHFEGIVQSQPQAHVCCLLVNSEDENSNLIIHLFFWLLNCVSYWLLFFFKWGWTNQGSGIWIGPPGSWTRGGKGGWVGRTPLPPRVTPRAFWAPQVWPFLYVFFGGVKHREFFDLKIDQKNGHPGEHLA